ncbi:MAG: DedA family protein [Gammaproteobacteria bacterium]|nr:DedA family protein [Gammaproteobacteria bacterium]
MKIFGGLYDRVLVWAKHRHATRILAGVSFAESFAFPIPIDVMMAPMMLSRPQEAYRIALITTIFSVIGGVFGYMLGQWGMVYIDGLIEGTRYQEQIAQTKVWFQEYGILIVFIAGFSPIPYKIFTISAGAMGMALLPFILISIVARASRFYLVAFVIRWGGEKMESVLRKNIEILGWLLLVLVILYVVFR